MGSTWRQKLSTFADAVTRGLSWLHNFDRTATCKYKYKNKAIYNLVIGTIKRLKNNIGKQDAQKFGESDIFNAQDLYTGYLKAKKEGDKYREKKLLKIGLRKFLRFFPIY